MNIDLIMESIDLEDTSFSEYKLLNSLSWPLPWNKHLQMARKANLRQGFDYPRRSAGSSSLQVKLHIPANSNSFC